MINDDDTPLETSESCAQRAGATAPSERTAQLVARRNAARRELIRAEAALAEAGVTLADHLAGTAWADPAQNADARPVTRDAWPARGVRVDTDIVVIVAKGNSIHERNAAARWMCAEVLARMEAQ